MHKSILRTVRLCLIVCSVSFFVGCKGKPIHRAAYKGDLEKVKKIIERNPSQINVQDNLGYTPLHLASGKGHIEIVEFLLNHGADIELEIFIGDTPLLLAARYARDGQYETIKTLLEHGAKVNHKDEDGRTALHKAAAYSGKEIMNLLISYGADVNARDKYQSTPLHQAAMLNNIEAAKALVEHGADIFAKNFHDYSKPLPEGMYLRPSRGTMNKTAKEIALKAYHIKLAQYLQTKEEEKEKKESAEMIQIRDLTLTDTTLTLNYRVLNPFEDSIWVCYDRCIHGEQDVQDTATRIDGEMVRIKLRFNLESVPALTDPQDIAKYVRLSPGESFSGRILRNLPIKDYLREWGAEHKEHKEIVLHRVVFEIGYIGTFEPKWNARLDSWAEKMAEMMKERSIEPKPRILGSYYFLPVNPLITEEMLDGQLRKVMYLQYKSFVNKEKVAEVLITDADIPCSIVIDDK